MQTTAAQTLQLKTNGTWAEKKCGYNNLPESAQAGAGHQCPSEKSAGTMVLNINVKTPDFLHAFFTKL